MMQRFLVVLFTLILMLESLAAIFMTLGWTIPLEYINSVFSSRESCWIIFITSLAVLFGGGFLLTGNLLRRPEILTKVSSNEHGDVVITIPAVETLVKKSAFQIKGVKEVKPMIKCVDGGIALLLKTEMQPGTNIPAAAQELQTAVKSYLEINAGIQVVEVKVLITNVSQEHKSRVD